MTSKNSTAMFRKQVCVPRSTDKKLGIINSLRNFTIFFYSVYKLQQRQYPPQIMLLSIFENFMKIRISEQL